MKTQALSGALPGTVIVDGNMVSGAAAPQPDTVDQLAKLADLHDKGALTDAEFTAMKAKILGSD
jgi:Short C-terminal domain